MRKLKLFSIIVVALFISCLFAQSAFAILGDVNGDGFAATLADYIYLINYLYYGGPPPPNPGDTDMDGTPGINLGDVLQLAGVLSGGCNLKPYTGVAPVFGNIEFTLPRLEPGPVGVQFSVPLKLSDNPGPDLTGIVIPFSYQNLPGYVAANLDSVSIVGSVVPSGWSYSAFIDNTNKKALVTLSAPNSYTPLLLTGTTGTVATLYFTRTQTGNPTCMSPTFYPPTHTPMLFATHCADGTPPSARVFIPKIGKKGDANSDGSTTVSDVTFLTRYLFQGGPAPCGW